MTDLNTAIAKFKGEFYSVTHGGEYYGADFEHDARLYMALFEEMPNPMLRCWTNGWLCIPETRKSMIIESIEVESDTIGAAICLAYMRLHGLECEG